MAPFDRSAATPAAGQLAAPIGVVAPHIALQRPCRFTLKHHLHQLVPEQPSRLPRNAEMAHQRQRRDIGFRLCHPVHRQIPGGQRQTAAL